MSSQLSSPEGSVEISLEFDKEWYEIRSNGEVTSSHEVAREFVNMGDVLILEKQK